MGIDLGFGLGCRGVPDTRPKLGSVPGPIATVVRPGSGRQHGPTRNRAGPNGCQVGLLSGTHDRPISGQWAGLNPSAHFRKPSSLYPCHLCASPSLLSRHLHRFTLRPPSSSGVLLYGILPEFDVPPCSSGIILWPPALHHPALPNSICSDVALQCPALLRHRLTPAASRLASASHPTPLTSSCGLRHHHVASRPPSSSVALLHLLRCHPLASCPASAMPCACGLPPCSDILP